MHLSNKYNRISRLKFRVHNLKLLVMSRAHAYQHVDVNITMLNSFSDRDYWYNLQKVYNFYSLF
jgi:hypothetical protein